MSSSLTSAESSITATGRMHGIQNTTEGDSRTFLVYQLALAVCICLWLVAIAAPLRLDETGTFWQISDGLSQIWPRRFWGLSFPVYPYILWLSTHVIGTSEAALRIPSVVGMLGAVYLLYLAARELFARDVAILTAIIFALHPITMFEAIDVRPYAFAALASNAAILLLLRFRRSDSNWFAVLFGLTAVSVVYFHFLFITLAPALVVCMALLKADNRRALLRQVGVAAGVFVLALIPLIPGLRYLIHTTGTHVYEASPTIVDLALTIGPGWMLPLVLITALALTPKGTSVRPSGRLQLLLCASLALIPLLILFSVSRFSSIHTFADRHRMDAIPGVALLWGWLLGQILSRRARLVFCLALVTLTGVQQFTSTRAHMHQDTMKYALQFADKNASLDYAPVIICSGFVESNSYSMPAPNEAKDSYFFAPLSYYRLSVPIVPLPQLLNKETIRIGSQFLSEPGQEHRRFLALGYLNSAEVLNWITRTASPSHSVRKLGVFQDVVVLEFTPRAGTVDEGVQP